MKVTTDANRLVGIVLVNFAKMVRKGGGRTYKTPHFIFILTALSFFLLLYFLLRDLDFTKMWAYGDVGAIPLAYQSIYESYIYVWSEENLGFLQRISYSIFLQLITAKIFGASIAQKIAVLASIVLPFFASYYLLATFRFGRGAKIAGALFYTINPVTVAAFTSGGNGQLMTYAAFPLVVTFMYKFLSESKFSFKYIAVLGAITLVLWSYYVAIPFALFILIPLLIFYFVSHERGYKKLPRMVPLSGILIIAILPGSILEIGRVSLADLSFTDEVSLQAFGRYSYKDISFLNLVRLSGNAGSPQAVESLNYNSHTGYTMFGHILSIIAISSLLFFRRSIGRPYTFLLISCSVSFAIIIGMALAIQSYPSLLDSNIIIGLLRNPEKLLCPLTFSFTILLAFGIESILRKVAARPLNMIITVAICIMVVLYNYPALDGTLGLKKVRGDTYFVEDKYEGLRKILESIDPKYREHRFLMLPWEYASSLKVRSELPNYFAMSLGAGIAGVDVSPFKNLFDNISLDSKDKAKLLSLFNVKYVVVDKSYDPSYSMEWVQRLKQLYPSVVYRDHSAYWLTGEPAYFYHIFRNDSNFGVVYEDKNFSVFENKLDWGYFFTVPFHEQGILEYKYDKLSNRLSPNLVQNPSFEDYLRDWLTTGGFVTGSNDSNEGENAVSLRGQEGVFAGISQTISVAENTPYALEFHVKGHNEADLYGRIVWYAGDQYFGARNSITTDIIGISADEKRDRNWTRISETIVSPDNSKYAEITILESASNMPTLVDNVTFHEVSPRVLGLPSEYGIVGDYERVSPTLYKVKLSTDRPITLAVDRTYDKFWRASIYKDGKNIQDVSPVQLYGVMNGFPINQTGSMDIVLEFRLQDLFEYVIVVQLAFYAFCGVTILYTLIKYAKCRFRHVESHVEKPRQ